MATPSRPPPSAVAGRRRDPGRRGVARPAGPVTRDAGRAVASSATARSRSSREAQSIDPAHHGDLGSASYVSQLCEPHGGGSVARDRPALAASWRVTDGGTKVTFTLRDGLRVQRRVAAPGFGRGHSWRRLFNARDPSPLASLIADVKGAPRAAGRDRHGHVHARRQRARRPDRRRGAWCGVGRPTRDRLRCAVRGGAAGHGRRRDLAGSRRRWWSAVPTPSAPPRTRSSCSRPTPTTGPGSPPSTTVHMLKTLGGARPWTRSRPAAWT